MKGLLVAVLMPVVAVGTARPQKLTGAGATFPYPIYAKWFSEYSAAHPGIEIRYQAVGSGEGIRKVSAGVVDFGAADVPLTDRQLAEARVKVKEIPALMGAVVPIFNVPGVSNLRFSGAVLADIYLGKITRWNDPHIVRDNPDVTLPDRRIHVVHRADVSGTSYIFTDYLSKVSREWAEGPGRSTAPSWPTGAGEMRNEGVAREVSRLPGALGYVELTYALQHSLSFGQVKNAAGDWVKASIESITAAAESIKEMPSDFRVSITNAPGAESYPISSFTFLLIPVQAPDAEKGRAIRDLVNWIVSSAQGQAADLSYAPLPQAIARQAAEMVGSLR